MLLVTLLLFNFGKGFLKQFDITPTPANIETRAALTLIALGLPFETQLPNEQASLDAQVTELVKTVTAQAQMTVDAYTDTPSPTPTASDIPTATPTATPNETATQASIYTEQANQTAASLGLTDEALTQIAQSTANAPTNTPRPTDTATNTLLPPTPTSTITPTATPTPTITLTATQNLAATAIANQNGTSTAKAFTTQIIQTAESNLATENAQLTANAPTLTLTPSITPMPTASFTASITPTAIPNLAATARVNQNFTATQNFLETESAAATFIALVSNPQATADSQTQAVADIQDLETPTREESGVSALIPDANPAQQTVQVRGENNINIRSEPSTSSTIVGIAAPNESLIVIGEDDSGTWLNVLMSDGTRGWVFAELTTFVDVLYAEAINRAWNFTGADNQDWEPYFYTFSDGIEMALVPVGCFMMGENGEGGRQCFNSPFWIDITEVTQSNFVRFGGTNISTFVGENYPVDSVSWFTAHNFCDNRQGRLPSEAEWEFAARGIDNLIFPWGNRFIEENTVWHTTSRGVSTSQVGSRPEDASWTGVLDMTGNLMEWTNTIYGIDTEDFDFGDEGEYLFSYPYNKNDGREEYTQMTTSVRVLRGGTWWTSSERNLRASTRSAATPNGRSIYWGFRCVRDIDN